MAVTAGKKKPGPAPEEIAEAMNWGGASGGAAKPGGDVYMGVERSGAGTVSPYAPTGATGQRKVAKPRIMSLDEAKLEYRSWSQKKRADFLAKLKIAGLAPIDAGPLQAGAIWEDLATEAAKYYAAGQPVTPMDILTMYIKGADGKDKSAWVRQGDFEVNSLTGEKRYVGPRFKTTTQTRIDLTDPATARAIATKMFQDLMGRNPGKGEIKTFAAALATAEQSNPVLETVTTEFDPTTGDPIGSNSVTSGGVTADAKALLAEDQIKADPEYGAVQATTTYMNALESAVYGTPE